MRRSTDFRVVILLAIGTIVLATEVAAQTRAVLPAPLGLADVIRVASERRDEIQAARARTRAGEARPTIVSALDDPMVSPSLDHLPFMLDGADVSVTITSAPRAVRHNSTRVQLNSRSESTSYGDSQVWPGDRRTGALGV